MDYLFATIAGGMVVLSMVMNSRLSRNTGVFQGVLINFAMGLLASILLFSVCLGLGWVAPSTGAALPYWYAYFGAFFGIGIVASCNVVIPKIPVVYSAVLIFLGQIITGIILDTLMSGFFDGYKAFGAVLITAGLFVNSRIDAATPNVT